MIQERHKVELDLEKKLKNIEQGLLHAKYSDSAPLVPCGDFQGSNLRPRDRRDRLPMLLSCVQFS